MLTPPPHPHASPSSFIDVGHSASAKKTLEKHRIGVLDPAEAAAAAASESASASGGGVGMYIAAAVALVSALYYQFVYVPSRAAVGGV